MVGAVVVAVVVAVLVQGQRTLGAKAEQGAVFRRVRHHARRAFATDMVVQADHPVTGRHDHMQIVADHQDASPGFAADLFDQPVECGFARLVQPLGRFIQHQQLRRTQQCAGQQHPLKLAAGQIRHLTRAKPGHPDTQQGSFGSLIGHTVWQREEATHRDRHAAVHRQPLWHITQPEVMGAGDRACCDRQHPQQRPQQR